MEPRMGPDGERCDRVDDVLVGDAVAVDQCPTHADRRCRACSGQLHRIVVDEGFDTHPCCDRPSGTGSHAVLEHTAQMLGATLLAQPGLSTGRAPRLSDPVGPR